MSRTFPSGEGYDTRIDQSVNHATDDLKRLFNVMREYECDSYLINYDEFTVTIDKREPERLATVAIPTDAVQNPEQDWMPDEADLKAIWLALLKDGIISALNGNPYAAVIHYGVKSHDGSRILLQLAFARGDNPGELKAKLVEIDGRKL